MHYKRICLVITLKYCIWFCIFMISSLSNGTEPWNASRTLGYSFCQQDQTQWLCSFPTWKKCFFFFFKARTDFNFAELKMNFLDFTYKMLPHLIDRFDFNMCSKFMKCLVLRKIVSFFVKKKTINICSLIQTESMIKCQDSCFERCLLWHILPL